MNALLWVLQAALVVILVPAAVTRAVAYDFAKSRMAWVAAVPRPLLLFISLAEIIGALGLVLPGLSGVAPQLTSEAAVGLGIIQALAFGFHMSRHESRNAIANLGLLALLIAVALGRSHVSL